MSKPITPELKKLLEHIRDNSWRESRALYPNPSWHTPREGLLRCIETAFELRLEDMNEILSGQLSGGGEEEAEK